MKYTTELNDPQKLRSSKYCRVAKELQEGLGTPLKKANAIIKGSTFNADFAEHAIKDYSDTTKSLWKGKASACNRCLKRAGTLMDEKMSCKKPTPECLVCGIQKYSIWDCWCLFEDKRPAGVIIRNACIKRVLKKVEKNKDLADQVAKIRCGEQEDET